MGRHFDLSKFLGVPGKSDSKLYLDAIDKIVKMVKNMKNLLVSWCQLKKR